MHRICVAVALCVAGIVLPGPAGADHGPGCPAPGTAPDSRSGRITAANRYLRALVTHDPSDVPLAPDATRVEVGSVSGTDGADLCDSLENDEALKVITGIRELRWFVDGEQAIGVYLLDTLGAPSYIFERFRVSGGLIHEIEANFSIDTRGYVTGPESAAARPYGTASRLFASDHGPLGPVAPADRTGDTRVPEPSSCGRACVEDAGRAYLGALVSRDASGVPLHASAVRTENRRPRGSSGDEIRAALEAGDRVSGVSDIELYVDGDQAIAYHLLDIEADDEIAAASGLTDNWSATRFRVVDGQILEIESSCWGTEVCS